MRKKNSVRHKFSQEEDDILRDLVVNNKFKNWRDIATNMPNRTARQCRDRWKNYLSSIPTNIEWTLEDDNMLINLVEKYGTKYSKIAKLMAGKSDINIKNRWFKLQRFWIKYTKNKNISNCGNACNALHNQNMANNYRNKCNNINAPYPNYYAMNYVDTSVNAHSFQVINNVIKNNLIKSFHNNEKLIDDILNDGASNCNNSRSQENIKNIIKDNKSSSFSDIDSFKSQEINLINDKLNQNKENNGNEFDQIQNIFNQNQSLQSDYDIFSLSGDEFNEFFNF